jgi:hypothetical protein
MRIKLNEPYRVPVTHVIEGVEYTFVPGDGACYCNVDNEEHARWFLSVRTPDDQPVFEESPASFDEMTMDELLAEHRRLFGKDASEDTPAGALVAKLKRAKKG